VVALSHWFARKERGTRYGIWSASHSIGEGLTFAGTAFLV
jgi:OPA family sugar phosphate sensor protein UhpC-like MFS transporter